jgi:hypothetical protein
MSAGEKTKLPITSRILILAFLVVLATYATLYTISAHHVADLWAYGSHAGYWCCMGSIDNATFFPWPRGPLGVCAGVTTKMNPVDEFIYLYLVKTGMLILVCFLLWVLAAVYFFKAILPLFREAWKLKHVQVRDVP